MASVKRASIAPPPTTPYEIGPGHVLGRYELLLPIAAGGMAMVWAARLKGTRGFQKIVAVKTMLPKLTEDDQFEKMFLDEASLASKIRHPHAVEILDLGEQDGVLFLAMEWIDGVPLNQLMKTAKSRGGVPIPVGLRILMQASAGLHAAHELTDAKGKSIGLVHRDISPQNILVTYDGVAKVVDFGVAKATALNDGATQAGQLKGKVSYMAPEQVRGEAIDRRVDVFAMGIVLYALTTGKHPFRKESEGATLFAISAPDPVIAPRKFLPDYPLALQEVLLKALEKDRDRRYLSANELVKALDQVLPPETRAADEDVAAFVRALFAEQRKQSQAALALALERADKHQLSSRGSIPIPGATASPSGVSSLSTVGGGSVWPSRNPSSSDFTTEAERDRRKLIRVGAVAGLFVVGALAAILLTRGGNKPPKAPATLAPTSTAAVEPTERSSPPLDLNALPIEPDAATSVSPALEEPPVDKKLSGRPALEVRGGAAPVPPKPSAAPLQPSWKHDPGF